MTNKILNLITIVCIGSGLACLIVKTMSKSYVDAQGILHEPFFLLPVGFGLITLGFIVLVISTIMKSMQA